MSLGDYNQIQNLEEAKLTLGGLILMLFKAILAFLIIYSRCCSLLHSYRAAS